MNLRVLGLLGGLAVATAVGLFACSTREYALCREHPNEDPTRCGDGSVPDSGTDGGACPADMVFIPVGVGYCIDGKETTVAQYQAFLATSPKTSNPTLCPWKQKPIDFFPKTRWDTSAPDDAGVPGQLAPGREQYPVITVDWCDAFDYCAAKGKHLCGTIGGGPAVEGTEDGGAWFNACTHGDDGFFTYPWGNDASAKASCNGKDRAVALGVAPALVPVGSVASCEGPYKGLFDILGNASEWIDLCAPNGQVTNDICVQRGGFFGDDQYLECAGPSALAARNGEGTVAPNVGIRCCK